MSRKWACDYWNFPLFVKLVVYNKKKIQMFLLNMSFISLVKWKICIFHSWLRHSWNINIFHFTRWNKSHIQQKIWISSIYSYFPEVTLWQRAQEMSPRTMDPSRPSPFFFGLCFTWLLDSVAWISSFIWYSQSITGSRCCTFFGMRTTDMFLNKAITFTHLCYLLLKKVTIFRWKI